MTKDAGSNKRIAKNTIYLYLRSFLNMAISIYSSRIVLEALGIDNYGIFGVVGSIVAMFTILNGVLAAGTSRFINYEMGKGSEDNLRDVFSASFAMHVMMALVLLVLLEIGGVWVLNHKMEIPDGREYAANIVLQLSIFTSLIGLTQVPYSACIIAHERMDIYAYIGIAEAVFKLALTFVLLYVKFVDPLIAYAIILAVWNVGLRIFYRIYCHSHFKESHLKICRRKEVYKNMLSYSLWDFVGQFCATGNNQGTNVLINMFFGVAVNAARSLAYTVEGALTVFSGNFMTSLQPQIVQSYARKEMKRFFELIYEGAKYSFFLLFLVSLPVFMECDYILHLWLVEVPEDSLLFFRCIIAITLFRVLARPLIIGVHATGHIKFLNMTSGIYSAMTFLPIIYLCYKLGLPVWYCFVVQGFNAFVCTWLEIQSLRREEPFNVIDYLKKVYGISIGVSLLASIPVIAVTLIMEQGFLRLAITTIVSIISTLCCVYTLAISPQVRQKINYYILNKLHGKNSIA